MVFIKEIRNIFTKKEFFKFGIVFFCILLTTILDTISFATIIPIFNIIFLDKIPSIPFLNNYNFELSLNIKIIFLICFIILFYLKNIFIIIFNYYFINFSKNINDRIAYNLFYYYLRQDYILYLRKSSENFLQKINNDVLAFNNFVLSFINFFIESIFIVAICFLLFFTNYKIFLICFISFSIVLIIYYKLFKERINNWGNIFRKSTGDAQNIIIDGSQGFKDIILYDLRENFLKNFDLSFKDSTRTYARISFLNNIQRYWLELVAFSVLVIALVYFVFVDFNINKLIPVFGLFILAIFRLLASVNKIIFSVHNLKFNYSSLKAISTEFNDHKNYKNNISSKKIIFNRSIEFKNIRFSYLNNGHNILNDISFKIYKNDCFAITGENGSGKTTLLNLIAGLIQISNGKAIIDDTFDIYLNREMWFKKLSYVQQNIFLLNDTLKANITLTNYKNEIDTIKFNKVINLLKFEEFFKFLPKKFDTQVGINGISLSGGQKQIISLARALYKDGEILIFDEATSALDANTTKIIKELILYFKGKKTIIIVTHNMKYFEDCFDKVIEIKAGALKILK
jgi:ABC-type multidrug transport system fused ATPase/permease subunit